MCKRFQKRKENVSGEKMYGIREQTTKYNYTKSLKKLCKITIVIKEKD